MADMAGKLALIRMTCLTVQMISIFTRVTHWLGQRSRFLFGQKQVNLAIQERN